MDDLSKRIAALSPAKRAILDQRLQAKGLTDESKVISRRTPSGDVPLSFAQERLCFLDQLEPGSCAYNIPQAYRLAGPLEIGALERSLREIVRRHEVLRTTFRWRDGKPIQVIAPAGVFDLPLADLSVLSDGDREGEVQRLEEEHVRLRFDLASGPLLRGKLLRLGAEDHLLLLNVHHIVSDGWSLGIFCLELSALYAAFREGKASVLPELPVQYADYAVWQREWLRGAELERQLAYWRKQLADAPTLELPTDHPRPPQQTYLGDQHFVKFSGELTDKLKAFNRREGATPFMSLLAAFQVLLARYTGQEDILVGSPIANRQHLQLENLIGFFVNTLVMRADLSANPDFREVVARVRQAALDAYQHQDLPFEKLVEELNPERTLNRHPIFQVMFAIRNAPEHPLRLLGLKTSRHSLPTISTHFDLELHVSAEGERWTGTFTYNTDLFNPATIERMAGHYQTLLEGMLAEPERPVSDVLLLTAVEQHQLLVEWNDTATDYPRDKCIHELFETQVEKTPEAIAVVFEDQQLTYRELNRRANQLAHRLRTLGVGPDILVGMCVERSLEMVIGLFGILKAGGAYVPLDIKNPRLRLQQQLKNVHVLVTRTETLEQLLAFVGTVVCLDRDHDELARYAESNPEATATAENLAYVIFTSGSTGVPKGVAIRHRNLVNYTHFIGRRLGLEAFTDGLKFALVSSVAADLGNTCIYPALLSGGCLHVVSSDQAVNPESFAHYVSRHEIDVLKITPSHLAALIASKHPRSVLPRHFLILGGEVLPPQLVERIRELAGTCRIINHYGPTETTVGSLTLGEEDFGPDHPQSAASVPIGRPIANTQAYILDANLQPVAIGMRAQLYIGGDGVALGYYNRPDLTAEKFIRNPFSSDERVRLYRTGDLARYLPDGNVEFLGRIDHQVKIRGFRIELGEIEAVLATHPKIQGQVVVVAEDSTGNKSLVAYLVARDQPPPTVPELRNFLKEKLPGHMIPAGFIFLESLPLTRSGKINRQALPAWSQAERPHAEQFAPPCTPAELQLTQIWQKILGVQTISVRDNFFDLGGHSLMAVRLVSEINKALQLDLRVLTLFQNPTIESLAKIVQSRKTDHEKLGLIQLRNGHSGPELFFILDEGSLGLFQLARLLDEKLSVYASVVPLEESALRASAKHQTALLPRLEDLAAGHADLIRSHQQSRPCLLAGRCFGGVLAFEVAQQLRRTGTAVEAVLMLDTWMRQPTRLWWFKTWLRTHVRNTLEHGTNYLWRKSRTRLNLEGRKLVATIIPSTFSQPSEQFTRPIVRRIYRNATKTYLPQVLASKGILLLSEDDWAANAFRKLDDSLGANSFFSGGVKVVNVPGDHVTILKEANLPELAQRFKKCLGEFHQGPTAQ